MAKKKTQEQEPTKPPKLTITREKVRKQITVQIEKGRTLRNYNIQTKEDLKEAEAEESKWCDYNHELLVRNFDNESMAEEYSGSWGMGVFGPTSLAEDIEDFRKGVDRKINKLKSILERLDLIPEVSREPDKKEDPLAGVKKICNRFHVIARQMRDRRENRPTLEVEDEYDVQDLLHALLRLFFDDVRPEEWTPSYAGKSARMDFLLKNEQIVVETKKTRKGLAQKEIGDELIIDIARYRQHSDCKTLFCFVYDPEGRISNPAGLENDLSRKEADLEVKVFIAPKGH